MNKTLITLFLLIIAVTGNPQTNVSGSFIHDGITRTYSFYVPSSYVPGNPVPMIIGLHGTGSSGASFAQYRDFRPIADTANFIMVHPDGTELFGIKFWNYGSVLGSSVDDVGFLEALIDTISSQYSINPQRIYCTGMSNGSFMTYYMACQTNRFAAIGSVTGSMDFDMYNNCNPNHPTPSIHIHGTDDPTNPYIGTSTMVGIDDLSRFWVNQNNCDTTPVIIPVANVNTGDNATADRYLYTSGTNGNAVELFKVYGGEHTWPGCPMPASSDIICMDFDARVEIWRFFNQYALNQTNSVSDYLSDVQFYVYPNPTREKIFVSTDGHTVNEMTIYDLQGRVVKKIVRENITEMEIAYIKPGNYLIEMRGKGFRSVKKLVVSK